MLRNLTPAALSTMLIAGCVNSYSPYGGYPGVPPGSYVQPQPYPTGPGSIYAPPTSVIPGPTPDTLNSAPSWGSGTPSAPIPATPPGGAYDPSSSPTFKNNSGSGGVPEYKDPSYNNDGFEAFSPRTNDSTGYAPVTSNNVMPSGYQSVPTYTGSAGDDQFLRPIAEPSGSAPQLQSVPRPANTVPAPQPPSFPADPWNSTQLSSPGTNHHYAYDGHYHWLQGRIHYDAQQQRWQIEYSASPSSTDPYGGRITLTPHNELSKCQSGDVIIVRGEIDNNIHDDAGKPVYKVAKVSRVTTQS